MLSWKVIAPVSAMTRPGKMFRSKDEIMREGEEFNRLFWEALTRVVERTKRG